MAEMLVIELGILVPLHGKCMGFQLRVDNGKGRGYNIVENSEVFDVNIEKLT